MRAGHGLGPTKGSKEGPTEDSLAPQASQAEQELRQELDSLRVQCQTQDLARAELRTQLESLQGEVSMGW